MPELPVLTDVCPDNCQAMPCCGVKNLAHEGRQRKIAWLCSQCRHGARAKVLLAPGNRQCGYIEYLPGEYAWRGVDAAGWMFIHCVWTFYRQYQHRGLGARMIEACVEDARRERMAGAAVLAREGPWLAGSGLFLANGFETVATAPPDYHLLVRRLRKRTPDPKLLEPAKPLARFGKGLTLIRADQCPHVAKFAGEIASAARDEYGLNVRVIDLASHREAQRAPTPYAVFSLFYNGRLLADHQISRTRFRNIMRKLSAG
jgi:hypothetical protein